ncbi:metallophosphoesterase [Castellaniella sp.]|uniref:metallophosphoesterase n=1 Tax=Castellaniella sp. TaxID=1955812 RepID=UPI002AFEDD88|nr:metallophosphoesterase [Castellaniella sp.]
MLLCRPVIQRFGINTKGRDLAVGDIHGCFSKLESMLQKIRFAPEEDRLFSVGDLVDRGPESHHVLDWLNRPWFHAICGNHDLMTWRRAIGDPYPGVDHTMHGGQWLDACNTAEKQQIAQRLRALPLAIEVETAQGIIGIVHADFPYDDWQAMHREQPSDDDEKICLWSSDRYRAQYTQPIKHVRAVVHGHTTLPKLTQLGNVFYIDTGGWRADGRFTLLDLQRLKAVC